MLKNDILLTIGGEIALYFFFGGGRDLKQPLQLLKKQKTTYRETPIRICPASLQYWLRLSYVAALVTAETEHTIS